MPKIKQQEQQSGSVAAPLSPAVWLAQLLHFLFFTLRALFSHSGHPQHKKDFEKEKYKAVIMLLGMLSKKVKIII